MKQIEFYSTNNHDLRVNFENALLKGQPDDFGLYMLSRQDLPKIPLKTIRHMQKTQMSYAGISLQVLAPYLQNEIPLNDLEALLWDAYSEDKIKTRVDYVVRMSYLMWLTGGPTYSFKDYAARFFGRSLNYFLQKRGERRLVAVATSGDTGGAVADALYGLENVDMVVFYPKGEISEGQRRQMTTLGKNIHAFEVNGDFDVCQALAKYLLGDKDFAKQTFGDRDRLTSANSISVGRLLPQAVYPFFAYSRAAQEGEKMIVSIPSGNFGDMMGTVIAKEMGLPVSKIITALNENTEFYEFLKTGVYNVKETVHCPSSAMDVSHPSNLARLVDFYGGHMYDKRDKKTRKVTKKGVISKMPDLGAMANDLEVFTVEIQTHYDVINDVHERHLITLDTHGAVGWKALQEYIKSNGGKIDDPAVVYVTADPGKFAKIILENTEIKAVPIPPRMQEQASLPERIYSISSNPDEAEGKGGKGRILKLSDAQIAEAKEKIASIFSKVD